MLQVTGGMDRLPAARLGNRIVYRAAVREIRQSERGVWVIYTDAKGQAHRVDADYCVSTIPLPVLRGIEKDLSPAVQSAIAASVYDSAGRIGLQFRRRFWEQDDQIYGGRSWTDQEIGQILYPSHGFGSSKGVLVGYFLDFKRTMVERSPAERQRLALEQGARIHAQYTTEFETAFSVMAPSAVEPRVVAVGVARGAPSARAVAAARRPRALCRRLHDRPEFVHAGRVRLGARGRDYDPQACPHAELTEAGRRRSAGHSDRKPNRR